MIAFYLVEDYTACSIHYKLFFEKLSELPTKPKGWEIPNPRPEGAWTMGYGMHNRANSGAYEKAHIPQPLFSQLPAIFCVKDGTVTSQFNVDANQAIQFIRKHLP